MAFARTEGVARDRAVLHLLRPFQLFLDNPAVTELSLCRAGEVWTRGRSGWTRNAVPELTANHLQALVTAIAVFNGVAPRSVNYVVLPGGERGTIALPPAVVDGTLSLVIRKHMAVVKTLDELNAEGVFAQCRDVSFNRPGEEECARLLVAHDATRLEPVEAELLAFKRDGAIRAFLEHAVLARRNVVVSGKTGSGKTTLARALIETVPSTERLVTIEDVHEFLLPNHPNRVHMLYGQGAGRIPAAECLAACMRQSPDRIFLAELRGAEAWDYLGSLNTGHPGSITTVHANGAAQAFERVATLVRASEAGRVLDMDTIRLVLRATIDVVLHMEDRRVVEVFYDPVFARKTMA